MHSQSEAVQQPVLKLGDYRIHDSISRFSEIMYLLALKIEIGGEAAAESAATPCTIVTGEHLSEFCLA